jgi:PAS domain S-box-containing protein
LVGATCGAAGLLDDSGKAFLHFLTSGTFPEICSAAGTPPPPLGLLAVPLEDHRPLRTSDVPGDPAALGFPANHPPMQSFLGAPLISRGRVRGSLYFTNKVLLPEFRLTDMRLAETLARLAVDIAEDVTPRPEILRALEILRGVLRPGAGAVMITSPAPAREVIFWSREMTALFGYAEDEALGQRMPDLLVPVEGRDFWRANVQPGLMRRLQEGRDAPFEAPRLHKSGERIHVRVVMSPIRHEVAGIMAVTRVYRFRRVRPEDPVPSFDRPFE